ncbi:MAG: SAM-dependent chlorinase/fluorinase [Anaerolineales bacterium]|jgi:S-adenosylmethionine hydrolase|nr:SAM-dependent chlorinase/fluorinase [Anaerolineales bacterium]
MTVISLMTDFGIKDGNVGVMKGVIWAIAPDAQLADLSHMIQPQNVREAALILARSASYFPPNSIHVVVVDPGVGTARRPLAAKIGSQRAAQITASSPSCLNAPKMKVGRSNFLRSINPGFGWKTSATFSTDGIFLRLWPGISQRACPSPIWEPAS